MIPPLHFADPNSAPASFDHATLPERRGRSDNYPDSVDGQTRAEVRKMEMNKSKPDVFKISDTLFERCERLGYENLRPKEKVFFCIWALEAEVNNGGFDQYYFNSAGDHAKDAANALQLIGANHAASLVTRANDLFGKTGPDSDQTKRQDQLEALPEAQMEKLTEEFLEYRDDLQNLLINYISEKAPELETD